MKKRILWYLLDSVFLIAFNTCFFLLKGNDHPLPVWISYAFMHFAYFILLFTPYFIRKGSAAADYGRPLFVITYIYFYVSYYLSAVIFVIYPVDYIIPLLANIVLTVTFSFFFLSKLIANEYTAGSIEKRESELVYVIESSSKLKSILNKTTDKQLAGKIEKIYDLMHSSPSKSSINVHEYEQEVMKQIQNLNVAVMHGETENILSISDEIRKLAEERNRQLKLLN